MSTITKSTITAEIYMPITVVIPRAIVAGVDEQTADYATGIFYAMANDGCAADHTARATVAALIRATLDGTGVTVLYTHNGEVSARSLFPSKVWLTDDNRVAVKAFCTYRNETRNFRADRMGCVQHITMPGEIPPADEDEPHADFEDSIAGRDFRALA